MKLTRIEYERLSDEGKRDHLASLEPGEVAALFASSPLGPLYNLPPQSAVAAPVSRPQPVHRSYDFNPLLLLIILLLCWPSWQWLNLKINLPPPALPSHVAIIPVVESTPATPAPPASETPAMTLQVAAAPAAPAAPAASFAQPASIAKSTKKVQPPNTREITYKIYGSYGSTQARYIDENGQMVQKMVTVPWLLKIYMPYDADFSLDASNPTFQIVHLDAEVYVDGAIYKRDEKTSDLCEVRVSGVVLKNL